MTIMYQISKLEITGTFFQVPLTTVHCTVYRFTYQQFFFQLFIVAPGDVPTPSWEHFCVHMYIQYDTAS